MAPHVIERLVTDRPGETAALDAVAKPLAKKVAAIVPHGVVKDTLSGTSPIGFWTSAMAVDLWVGGTAWSGPGASGSSTVLGTWWPWRVVGRGAPAALPWSRSPPAWAATWRGGAGSTSAPSAISARANRWPHPRATTRCSCCGVAAGSSRSRTSVPTPAVRYEVELDGDCVRCPWHGSVFRLDDGSVVHGRASGSQPAYDVRVEGGRVSARRR